MEQKMITIEKERYERLVRKPKIADDAIVQLHLSLEDLKKGRVSKF